MARSVSVANFMLLADFFQLEAESPEEALMQSEDLEIFLDVLYEEADWKGQQNYDHMIQSRDPDKMPWAALHPVEGEDIPAFYLLLNRRDDLEGDELLPVFLRGLDWKGVYDLYMKMRDGWRPPEWGTSSEDPYVDPYSKDPTTQEPVGDLDPAPENSPASQQTPASQQSPASQQNKPVFVNDDASDAVKSERVMLLIGGGIGAAVIGGIWLTTSLLKA